jgi:two-component system, chemotaxis family, CheB/CheR fusion protein
VGDPELSEALFASMPVGVVVVDRRYDIQAINPAARALLGIHGAAIGADFVHLAQNLPSKPLYVRSSTAYSDARDRQPLTTSK